MNNDATEIANLLYLYAERVDTGDAAGVAALFQHADVKWGVDAPTTHGDAPILELYNTHIKLHEDGTPRTHHLITNPIIEIAENGAEATVRSYYTVVQQTTILPLQVIASGRYHDVLEKIEGKWRFAKRDYLMDMRGNISEHVKKPSSAS
ncbi:nuclear transport factor 2 family protein [Terriglobus saanensis]|uniref:Aromatic-ring-hydroxylating dioxygenase beta subunit n=1 Tax=Terriglobus saanensis (strain ATCC BAA-1853 / DSM 23119 / SP1PR4) TaxID=401053 RepID=E8V3X4_TERSS|nr:nuclear transport factor 2 family protein [Terriglobus saanensis]ADV81388.1 aromatic-ring-hydroxylating dioxygenase beta subunit [Terriglobus saanensis SP1PR4]